MKDKPESSGARIVETAVGADFDGMRIDAFLARRFTYLSRSAWQSEIREGKILLNGREPGSPHRQVRAGDVVRFSGRELEEPPVDERVEIIHEDRWLVALSKSGNMPVHPSGRYFNNTLVRIMERRLGCRLLPAHRLDRETSGIILLAKDPDTASRIQRNFSRVSKSYVAVVHGRVCERRFVVDVPIGYDPSSEIKKRRLAWSGAPEQAFTAFKTLFSFGDYSLVRAYPRTGRLHQIRVHLSYAGYPIVGDKMYGKDPMFYLRFISEGLTGDLMRELEMPRSALHSRSLKFFHPHEKRTMYIKAPLPDDIREFIKERSMERCQNP
jgi:RluA family pseudouridine synthase